MKKRFTVKYRTMDKEYTEVVNGYDKQDAIMSVRERCNDKGLNAVITSAELLIESTFVVALELLDEQISPLIDEYLNLTVRHNKQEKQNVKNQIETLQKYREEFMRRVIKNEQLKGQRNEQKNI